MLPVLPVVEWHSLLGGIIFINSFQVGSHATKNCESRQIRKEAAVEINFVCCEVAQPELYLLHI